MNKTCIIFKILLQDNNFLKIKSKTILYILASILIYTWTHICTYVHYFVYNTLRESSRTMKWVQVYKGLYRFIQVYIGLYRFIQVYVRLNSKSIATNFSFMCSCVHNEKMVKSVLHQRSKLPYKFTEFSRTLPLSLIV